MTGNKRVELGIRRVGDEKLSFDCLKGLLKVLIDREGELMIALDGVLGGAER